MESKYKDSHMHKTIDTGILTFVPDLWDNYWASRHHVMSRLSQHYKVLWVSPPLPWRKAFSASHIMGNSRGIKKQSSNLWIYEPEWYLPCKTRIRVLSRSWDWIRKRRIKGFLSDMGIKRLILYLWRPEYFSCVGKFDEDLVCYHIDDEYTFSFDKDQPVSDTERELIRNSDLVFIHSKSLLKKKGSLNFHTFYIPNGVAYSYYREVMDDPNAYFCELDEIPEPRIGYVGIIKKQIDLDLILEIARKRKNWSIVLIGPISKSHKEVQKKIELLRKEKNVFLLGGIKPDDLPKYIKKLDVCLMCYQRNEYTKYIYPMKVNEYLACGKPVVSVYLENLEEFESVLYFASDVSDWISKIEKCVKENDSEKTFNRIKWANQNSWDSRIEKVVSIFQEKLCKNSLMSEKGTCR